MIQNSDAKWTYQDGDVISHYCLLLGFFNGNHLEAVAELERNLWTGHDAK
jgi:hypothetical protein